MARRRGDRRPVARARRAVPLGAAALVALCACQSIQQRVTQTLNPGPPVELENTVDLLPPSGLRVLSTESRRIALAWDPVLVGDVAGYAVLRSRFEGGEYELAGRTRSRFETVYTDPGSPDEPLGDGETIRYRVLALDEKGSVSNGHAHISATTDPRPEPPAGLHAYSNLPRKVVLAWDPATSAGVAGYGVLRSPTLAGPWHRVATLRGRLQTVHEDAVPGDLRVLYYRLVSFNAFDAESEMSEPIRAVTKAEPLPPTRLVVAERRLGAIVLAWTPNVERDLDGYRIYRTSRGPRGWRAEQLIAAPGPRDTTFTDADVGCAQLVRYRLRAVDGDGLQSDFSLPLETAGETLGLEVRIRSDGVPVLHWDTALARPWPLAEVTEVRGALPDRLLGEVGARGPFALDVLDPGPRRVGVTLTERRQPGARSRPRHTPRCDLDVDVGKIGP